MQDKEARRRVAQLEREVGALGKHCDICGDFKHNDAMLTITRSHYIAMHGEVTANYNLCPECRRAVRKAEESRGLPD